MTAEKDRYVKRACPEHSLPRPCVRCALLCPCGCDNLRDGVSEEVWEAVIAMPDPTFAAEYVRIALGFTDAQ